MTMEEMVDCQRNGKNNGVRSGEEALPQAVKR
jgi:hypothetical protein